MIETEEDRLEMLKALGEVVIVAGREVYGIFETAYIELGFDAIDVGSKEPMLSVRTSDVVEADTGDTVKRQGSYYSIEKIEPDGEGITLLKLAEL